MHETGHSKLVHWDNPEGWDGEGDGRRVQDVGHTYTHGWFMSIYGKKTLQYCKVITLQLKLINFLKRHVWRPSEKNTKDMNKHFMLLKRERERKWKLEKYSISLEIKEIKINTAKVYHVLPIIIKKEKKKPAKLLIPRLGKGLLLVWGQKLQFVWTIVWHYVLKVLQMFFTLWFRNSISRNLILGNTKYFKICSFYL